MTQTKDVSADPEVGKEVSIELAMPRASVQLVVRVTSGANQEPLKDATLTLRCQNPASATVGDQGTNSIGDHRITTSDSLGNPNLRCVLQAPIGVSSHRLPARMAATSSPAPSPSSTTTVSSRWRRTSTSSR